MERQDVMEVNWVTGKKTEMELKDIESELFELARDWISASKLKKLPGYVEKHTNVALWKKFREYPQRKVTISVRLYIALCHRC
jgi:hypothetical protein